MHDLERVQVLHPLADLHRHGPALLPRQLDAVGVAEERAKRAHHHELGDHERPNLAIGDPGAVEDEQVRVPDALKRETLTLEVLLGLWVELVLERLLQDLDRHVVGGPSRAPHLAVRALGEPLPPVDVALRDLPRGKHPLLLLAELGQQQLLALKAQILDTTNPKVRISARVVAAVHP